MNIYVVTNTENGWDCVVGVYDSEDLAEQACMPYPEDVKYFKENGYLTSDGKFETYNISCKTLNETH